MSSAGAGLAHVAARGRWHVRELPITLDKLL